TYKKPPHLAFSRRGSSRHSLYLFVFKEKTKRMPLLSGLGCSFGRGYGGCYLAQFFLGEYLFFVY
ncbi:hypothetical protein, partial [Flavobacterium branchiophilum]|uniref:hypothetical protein n=1 Tax=Flavobacterium branchiophilum TaxID=55197 RepID=UPI0039EEAC8F